MITHKPAGDILKSRCQTLVCPVNTVGVMGAGLALAMNKHFKGLLYRYRLACRTGALSIDNLWIYTVNTHRQILCLATKVHWRDPSQVQWIDANLKQLSEDYQELNITSIAIPMLGCGLGGLKWKTEVRPLVYKHLEHLPITIEVYGP